MQQSLARAEVKRLEARIAAGLLDDPSPFGRATHLSVEIEESAAAPVPAQPTARAPSPALAPPQGSAPGSSGPP